MCSLGSLTWSELSSFSQSAFSKSDVCPPKFSRVNSLPLLLDQFSLQLPRTLFPFFVKIRRAALWYLPFRLAFSSHLSTSSLTFPLSFRTFILSFFLSLRTPLPLHSFPAAFPFPFFLFEFFSFFLSFSSELYFRRHLSQRP